MLLRHEFEPAAVRLAAGVIERWDLIVRACPTGPVNDCTAGTSSNGCSATMSSAGVPSITSGPGAFTLAADGIEGQKLALIFYGVSGRHAATWGQGSSIPCVKSPSQRIGAANTGGSAGSCDGSLSLDFFAFMSAHAFALGQPLTAGEVFNAQAWYRDPPAPKSTSLSDGLEFTLVP